jgi:hypothetical protein
MLKKLHLLGLLFLAGLIVFGFSQERQWPEKNFFDNSLHHTSRGLAFWYSKEQGGVEKLTGIPITQLNCLNCHVQSCDACHAKTVEGGQVYSTEQARSQKACFDCHGLGDVEAAKKNNQFVDLHFEKGMKCLDCHTAREIHGDGKAYDTYSQEGVLGVSCRKCHDQVSSIPSHNVHKDKLDCNACHLKELPSCHNCHMETRVKEGKSHSLPLHNVFFLVNSRDKVTLATCLSFVYQNKTMIEFSPSFSHAVAKQGRACPECHATQIIKDIRKKTFRPLTWTEAGLKNVSGVIPVLDGLDWNFPFLDFEQGKWALLQNPGPPRIQYAGYCTPLTAEQFRKLEIAPISNKEK